MLIPPMAQGRPHLGCCHQKRVIIQNILFPISPSNWEQATRSFIPLRHHPALRHSSRKYHLSPVYSPMGTASIQGKSVNCVITLPHRIYAKRSSMPCIFLPQVLRVSTLLEI